MYKWFVSMFPLFQLVIHLENSLSSCYSIILPGTALGFALLLVSISIKARDMELAELFCMCPGKPG